MPPKIILLDADGVVWRGNQPIEGAAQFIERARSAGTRVLLLSNNAGPDRIAYEGRCERLGIPLKAPDIFSVNHLAGPYVEKHHPGESVLVVGSGQLVSEMGKYVPVTSAQDWLAERDAAGRAATVHDLKLIAEAQFDVLVIGIDVTVNYLKLALMCSVVQKGAALLGANPDYSFPVEGGIELPGNGSIVELVAGVSGVRPVYLGKPEVHLLELVEEETGVDRSDMIMVGDRIETDIEFARRAGLDAYLVLTGVSSRADVPENFYPRAKVRADLEAIADDLGI